MRKTPLLTNEIYHIYNRGVDKRDVFLDNNDLERFFVSIKEFNSDIPIGSLYQKSFHRNQLSGPTTKLVEIVAYCLNTNHYHLIVQQVKDGGISEFMKRLAGGYSRYFNEKNKRNGALFQGKFKSVHVNSDNYLKHLSAYVNLNFKIGKLSGPTTKWYKSSWDEYLGDSKETICKKSLVLEQFKGIEDYKNYCEESLKDIINRKKDLEWGDFEDIHSLSGPTTK